MSTRSEMNFEIFVKYLTTLGIVQDETGEQERIGQIFLEIDESDIRGAQQLQSLNQLGEMVDEDANSEDLAAI